jgi:hypothetical protein
MLRSLTLRRSAALAVLFVAGCGEPAPTPPAGTGTTPSATTPAAPADGGAANEAMAVPKLVD